MGAPSYLPAGAASGPVGQMDALGYGSACICKMDLEV